MKKVITVITIIVFCVVGLFAQTPEKFSYQVVVRNKSNVLVVNEPVAVRVSILQGSTNGNVIYVETHSAVTNANGLLTVEIGGGKVQQGEFTGIDWSEGPYFLKIETDSNGGENYSVVSVQQPLSVPYALYAKEAANGFSGDYNDLKNKPAIPQNIGDLTNDAGYITMGDLPKGGGEANDADMVKTTACGEIDLCEMANRLAHLRAILLPTVTTGTVSNITETTAQCGGEVTANGYTEVTKRGVCWNTEPNPTVGDSHTSDGTGLGAFISNITGLEQGTLYYIRAYATNSVGTTYGEEVSFTTAEEQPQDTCNTISLPYSEGFDSYTTSTTSETGVQPSCWKVITEDVALTNSTMPQIYHGYATSGSYSMRLKNRCVYAMPALDENINVNTLTMSFQLRQPKSIYRLQVGVVEDGGFHAVKTINNASTSMEQVTVDFSGYTGNGHRIAFRNTLIKGSNIDYSYNYIDDIVLYYADSVGGDTLTPQDTLPVIPVGDSHSCPDIPIVTDHEGNVYNTVQIGNQCWLRENLRTMTSPSTGTYLMTPADVNNTYTGKQARWYNNDSATYAPMNYGLLYNWNAAVDTFNTAYGETSVNSNTSSAISVNFNKQRRGICPEGWHLPSDAEWTQLANYVGSVSDYQCDGNSSNIAKALSSTSGWKTSTNNCVVGNDQSTNNATAFSAVPAGYCRISSFNYASNYAFFWSSTESSSYSRNAYTHYLSYQTVNLGRNDSGKDFGRSVRCVHDTITIGGDTLTPIDPIDPIEIDTCPQLLQNYYGSAESKKGYALRVAMHNIIENHTSMSYNGLWDAFYTTDVRPDNNKVWDMYSDRPGHTPDYYFTFGSDQCGSYSVEGDCYNREHSVPKSWFNSVTPMYTDLFHLIPTDGFVNSKRGNLPLGKVTSATWTSTNGSKVGNSNISGYSGQVFEPIDSFKGDFARIYFYMAVCYMDKDLGVESQSNFSGGNLKPWAKQLLLQWAALDPVSQKEIDRNNAVYQLQHNRNPFVDYPELAGMIFGSDTNTVFHTCSSQSSTRTEGVSVQNPSHQKYNSQSFEYQDINQQIKTQNEKDIHFNHLSRVVRHRSLRAGTRKVFLSGGSAQRQQRFSY